jgi:hypothetical protein
MEDGGWIAIAVVAVPAALVIVGGLVLRSRSRGPGPRR